MAEQKGAKAPDKTPEGLRRVGVVLYDTDPDQLTCITCGQQWQATSLRGHWWHCPKGCSHWGTCELPWTAVERDGLAR